MSENEQKSSRRRRRSRRSRGRTRSSDRTSDRNQTSSSSSATSRRRSSRRRRRRGEESQSSGQTESSPKVVVHQYDAESLEVSKINQQIFIYTYTLRPRSLLDEYQPSQSLLDRMEFEEPLQPQDEGR